jgi:nucleotide-binding universal stress UspA family protein
MMYHTIVLALDGSEGSRRAIPVATELAHRDGARIVIVHARTHAIEPELEAEFAKQLDDLRVAGISAELIARSSVMGREADVLNEVAVKEGADLIVTSNRGMSSLEGVLLGSVTQRLLHFAHCPVLVVPVDAVVAATPELASTGG